MKITFVKFGWIFGICVLILSACNTLLPGGVQPTKNVPGAADTQVAAAAEGTATQMAVEKILSNILTQTAAPALATPTLAATHTPAPTNTPAASATATAIPPSATATMTSAPTSTPTSTQTALVKRTPTEIPVPCAAASFVKDVTYPDGSSVFPGQQFTKTWRLKNTGTCSWTNKYALVFSKGDQMGAPASIDFNTTVTPGQEVDISVTLVTPKSAGTYKGYWTLRDDKGVLFGVGGTSSPFYVEVVVGQAQGKYPLDFANAACTAEWGSGAGKLDCPGKDSDKNGSVTYIAKPHLETGQIDNEPALLTIPQAVTDGTIAGKYPSFHVETGQHFQSIVGCEFDAAKCSVKFQLSYQIGNGAVQTLKSWDEKYDNQFTSVDVDLSSLAGQDVKFILTVLANGDPTGDRALWLAPRILKP